MKKIDTKRMARETKIPEATIRTCLGLPLRFGDLRTLADIKCAIEGNAARRDGQDFRLSEKLFSWWRKIYREIVKATNDLEEVRALYFQGRSMDGNCKCAARKWSQIIRKEMSSAKTAQQMKVVYGRAVGGPEEEAAWFKYWKLGERETMRASTKRELLLAFRDAPMLSARVIKKLATFYES